MPRQTITQPAAEEAKTATPRCWCGGEFGARDPGDVNGLGCLEDIHHVSTHSPELPAVWCDECNEYECPRCFDFGSEYEFEADAHIAVCTEPPHYV